MTGLELQKATAYPAVRASKRADYVLAVISYKQNNQQGVLVCLVGGVNMPKVIQCTSKSKYSEVCSVALLQSLDHKHNNLSSLDLRVTAGGRKTIELVHNSLCFEVEL